MNMLKMMKQAQELQAKAQKVQGELGAREYTASLNGVTAVANGEGSLLSLKIDPAIVKTGEAEILEDLVVTAVREAVEKGRTEMQAEMKKLTAGLGLPGF
jgi:nucleoid-associated protein EbfC